MKRSKAFIILLLALGGVMLHMTAVHACDMTAMISISPNVLGDIPATLDSLSDPHDFFTFLKSRSGPHTGLTPLNDDGYGVVYYQYGSTDIPVEQCYFKPGLGVWYEPLHGEPMEMAEEAITDPVNRAVIMLGHDRNGSGGVGNHPFLFHYDDRTWSLMHNGSMPREAKVGIINTLGASWFEEHPSNWYGVYPTESRFVDTELLFHFIMSKIIKNSGNVIAGIKAALNSSNVQGFDFQQMVYEGSYIINFVMSDGEALYIFRNSDDWGPDYNLSYENFDGKFIAVKTQDSMARPVLRNTIVKIQKTGDITIYPIEDTLALDQVTFHAAVTTSQTVALNWTTASEHGNTGFNIYRSNVNDLMTARKMNITMIPATNDVNGSSYSYVDAEIQAGTDYFYWLENISQDGATDLCSQLKITVPAIDDPDEPEVQVSTLGRVYPNPCRNGQLLQIPLDVKIGDHGKLVVYNLKGQKLRVFQLNNGTSIKTWDGKDDAGEMCPSGIYFLRLETGMSQQSQRIVRIR